MLFTVRTKIYSGKESLEYLKTLTGKTIWIVGDPFLRDSESLHQLLRALPQQCATSLFFNIVPDPPIPTIAAGVVELCAQAPDVVIGFGGGSAIDSAKAMIYFARKQGTGVETFIAIPTTSGTGSEVTHASVISDPQKKIKYPLFDESLYPDIALLVPEFVASVPPGVTANTGMDVLTHALEAWVATGASDFTDALAIKAVRLVLEYLPLAWQNGKDLIAREKMHNASTLAGIAFSQAGLGLNHAIAHQLGGQFHVPHGLANALLLPHVVQFNSRAPKARTKYAQLSRECGLADIRATNEEAVNSLISNISHLSTRLNMAITLTALNISIADVMLVLDDIADAALNDATFKTNPTSALKEDIAALIQDII